MQNAGDCTVRAISHNLGQTWDETYAWLCVQGFKMKNMPSINSVWGAYLKSRGYHSKAIPDTCPDCYTVVSFCRDHPKGKFILATGTHVISVCDGDYYDTWDSGDEVPVYYWERE